MSSSTRGGDRGRPRTPDLSVHRWVQLGAASAGMGAALIGWSLVGSEMGVASADSGVGSPSSAGPVASSSNGVDSGSVPPTRSGRAGPVAPRVDARSTTPRKAKGTVSAPSNRPASADTSSVPDGQTATVNSRVTSRVATPNRNQLSASRNAVTPVVVAANRADPLGALGRFVTSTIKELLNRKTTLNPLQKLDDLSPKQKSLLDLIPSPKVTVPKEHSLWYREVQASETARQQRADANQQRIADIMQKGVRFTARDGTPVYTIDGKVFVHYTVVAMINGTNAPPVPRLFTLSDRMSERNRDTQIKLYLKLDPAQVRSLRGQ